MEGRDLRLLQRFLDRLLETIRGEMVEYRQGVVDSVGAGTASVFVAGAPVATPDIPFYDHITLAPGDRVWLRYWDNGYFIEGREA